jgi:hypothetical protein
MVGLGPGVTTSFHQKKAPMGLGATDSSAEVTPSRNQLAVGVFFLAWLALWVLTLWTPVWWVFVVLLWLAAITGVVTRAATGRTNASAAVRRL